MSEITKLYEKVGVSCKPNYVYNKAPILSGLEYPPFTAEKQIELIKILAKGEIKIDNTDGEYEFSIFDTVSDFNSFEESLADLTNRMWLSLTPEEKQQVKEILE